MAKLWRAFSERQTRAGAIGYQGAKWWAMQGLNLRPSPCEGDALPLRQSPAPYALLDYSRRN
jgi:hypothetical protein